MSDSSRATVEVIKARKSMSQGNIPLPGSGDSVIYNGAQRKLSVVETCNGGPGTTTSLRVEVITDEAVATAGRPNYRIAIDIPLDEALSGILATALDRAEENARSYGPGVLVEEGFDPDSIPTPRAILEERQHVPNSDALTLGQPAIAEPKVGFMDPSVEAVLQEADKQGEKNRLDGLEEDAFGPDSVEAS